MSFPKDIVNIIFKQCYLSHLHRLIDNYYNLCSCACDNMMDEGEFPIKYGAIEEAYQYRSFENETGAWSNDSVYSNFANGNIIVRCVLPINY